MDSEAKRGKKISTTVLKDEDFYNRKKSDLKIILIGDSARKIKVSPYLTISIEY